MCGYLRYSSLAYHGSHAFVGLIVLAVGAVLMVVTRRRPAAAAARS
jgi:hypothetical protein